MVGEIPTTDLDIEKLDGDGTPLTELLMLSGLAPSKGQARKDIEGGGIYVNNVKSPDINRSINSTDLLFGKYVLLRKGKRSYAVLAVSYDASLSPKETILVPDLLMKRAGS